MSRETTTVDQAVAEHAEYEHGVATDSETDTAPPGLSTDVIRLISNKKKEPEWLLDMRLKAFEGFERLAKHGEPGWAKVNYKPIDLQSISYYSAPKVKEKLESLDEVDPELLSTFDKLGIPLHEQKMLAGVAVDAVFDTITGALKGGDGVQLIGFGNFSVADRAARQGRNPRTGEAIQIAASKQPKFKAGKALKDAVNG